MSGRGAMAAATRPFVHPPSLLGAVAGALGLGFVVLAIAPEVHGSPSPHEVVAESSGDPSPEPPVFVAVSALFGIDRYSVSPDESAPEGGIAAVDADAESSVPALAASSTPASRFVLPLKNWQGVTDRYGAYRGPGWVHGGIDLDVYNSSHTPIYSACSGVVSTTTYSSSYGYHVIVDCGEGWTTLYGHMSAIYVTPGEGAAAGQSVLGTTGNTGFSTGEHLHFEIRYNGATVNPERYLDFGIAPGAPLSVDPPVSTVRRTTTTWAPTPVPAQPSASSSGDTSPTTGPAATPTPAPPTVAPTQAPPTPIPSPTPIPGPAPHARGFGECGGSPSAPECGGAPLRAICDPAGWFIDAGWDYVNVRGWREVAVHDNDGDGSLIDDAMAACR